MAAAVFEPPPRRYFQPDALPFRLQSTEDRAAELHRFGVDHVYELPFDDVMANLSHEAFIEEVLVQGLGVRHVSVGFDFHFGKGRAGSATSLAKRGEALGFGVSIVERVDHGGVKASSTAIRDALDAGNPRMAATMLGRWWTMRATVEHGEKRGRTIGFPTANLRLGDLLQPRHGIYAVLARVDEQEGWWPGVANFGRTPTTGLRDPLLEVYLFDFQRDLYGRPLEVAFCEFLRPEAKFDSLEALVEQMHRDSDKARETLSLMAAASPLTNLPRPG